MLDCTHRSSAGRRLLTPVCACACVAGGLRGASIIDSLDTLYIMGLMEEYNDAKEWVKTSLDLNSVRSRPPPPAFFQNTLFFPLETFTQSCVSRPDEDLCGGRAWPIDYKRRLCVLTAALCRRSLGGGALHGSTARDIAPGIKSVLCGRRTHFVNSL